MSGSFQTFTNQLQAPAIAGDFASANPRATNLATQVYGVTGFVAGANGLTIGLFAWLDPATYRVASNSGSGAPSGFVHRNMEALITVYLNAYGMTIPAGMMVGDLFDSGDFWIVNNGTTQASPGMKAYANNSTGQASFALTGNPTAGGSGTASTLAAGTASSAASTITDNIFAPGPSTTGTFQIGSILSGTGVASGTQITGTGPTAGTFIVAPREQTVASTTISATYGTLTVGGTVTGTFQVGQTVTGTSVLAGTVITALGSGTGGAGTYIVNLTQVLSSQTIGTNTNTETGWYCRSFGQPGELVKISSRFMG